VREDVAERAAAFKYADRPTATTAPAQNAATAQAAEGQPIDVGYLMTAIQEFASTYSLAGTRFDDGTVHEQAMEKKEAICELLASLRQHTAPTQDKLTPQQQREVDGFANWGSLE
jgi:hypothetical protein